MTPSDVDIFNWIYRDDRAASGWWRFLERMDRAANPAKYAPTHPDF